MNQFKAEVLQSIVASGEPWISPIRICELVQCPPDVVQDCLADLETDDLIDAWETDEGIFIRLTPLAKGKVPSTVGSVSATAIENESEKPDHEWQGAQRFDEYALPYPTVLIGSGTALWDNVRHTICPGCGNRRLKDYEFCLLCDRWGLDHLLKKREGQAEIRTYRENTAKSVDMNMRIQKRKERRVV